MPIVNYSFCDIVLNMTIFIAIITKSDRLSGDIFYNLNIFISYHSLEIATFRKAARKTAPRTARIIFTAIAACGGITAP